MMTAFSMATATVGEIAARSPAAVRVFEKLGIDYCCRGERPVTEACREKGLDPAVVMAELDQAEAPAEVESRNWAAAPLSELIEHILDQHHASLRAELPLIGERLAIVQRVHGERDGAHLRPLAEVFAALWDELNAHMRKEEMILFPFVERCERAAAAGAAMPSASFGSMQSSIHVMRHEHHSAGRALSEIRRLTAGYTPPTHACNTYRALYAGLEELERDLHLHIHLENNILFPRALALEQKAAGVP
jgi:regulator of cell morphogenesis and NO signaling